MARRLTSQERRLADLVKKMEPSVRAAFEAAIKKAGAAIDVPALVAALEGQDITTAMTLLQIRPEAFAPMAEALRFFAANGERECRGQDASGSRIAVVWW